jgi:hypothetical protein
MDKREYAQTVARKALEIFSKRGKENSVEYTQDVIDLFKEEGSTSNIEFWEDVLAALAAFCANPITLLKK